MAKISFWDRLLGNHGKPSMDVQVAPPQQDGPPMAAKEQPAMDAEWNFPVDVATRGPLAFIDNTASRGWAYNAAFDGSTNLGEMSPAMNYSMQYDVLRVRGYEGYLTSDIIHTGIKRKNKWVIGAGLSLQCTPNIEVLESEGITLDPEPWNKRVEARFNVWANSNESGWTGNKCFGAMQAESDKHKSIGGDIVVILRYKDGCVKVQHIDGANCVNPVSAMQRQAKDEVNNSPGFDFFLPNGNRVRQGVEIDGDGRTVAFHIRVGASFKTERVKAYNRYGMLVAFIVKEEEFRIDSARGIPSSTTNMEGAAILKRYKEAAVGGAEERAKIAYFTTSTVENIGDSTFAPSNLAKAKSAFGGNPPSDLPVDVYGTQMNNTVSSTSAKTFLELDQNRDIKAFGETQEMQFAEFYNPVMEQQFASFGIPPEVALMKYGGSFSSSRAGLKDWEHSLIVDRVDFSRQYNQNVYCFWLLMEVLNFKIEAPGLIAAWMSGNYMVVGAYMQADWVGANVPHIDPLKEVNAERAKLGPLLATAPLTTVESSTRALNGGESSSNFRQAAKEREMMADEGLEVDAAELTPTMVEEDETEGNTKPAPQKTGAVRGNYSSSLAKSIKNEIIAAK